MSRVARVPGEVAAPPAISDASLGELRGSFRGDLLRPGDDGYEAARQVWNGMIDRRPALVARCTGTADVAAAVRFARTAELEIAVRSGGHSVAGHSTTEGGIVIDLGRMCGVRIDPDARVAWVQGGARLGQLDHEAQLFGLASPTGTVSTTGVGGLTLGGGYGVLTRRHGLACDNIRSAEVVTADGEVVHADASRHEDLFWALRGGGGNFGIVTTFELQLHPVGPQISYGDMLWPLEEGFAPLRAFVDFAPHMPEDMFGIVAVATVKPEWGLEAFEPGRGVLSMSWIYLGDVDEGRRVAAPLYSAPPTVDTTENAPYVKVQQAGDASGEPGLRRYWKGAFTNRLTDAALETMLGRGATDGSAPPWGGELAVLGGAYGRVGEDETAFSGRDATMEFLAICSWKEAADDERLLGGVRRYFDVMQPHLQDLAYVNSLSPDDQGRVGDAYGAAKYERLRSVKRAYDPQNVFHLNQNIRP